MTLICQEWHADSLLGQLSGRVHRELLALGTPSYNSTGGPITFDRLGAGDYRLRIAGIGWLGANAIMTGDSGQVVMLGSASGHCRLIGLGPQNYHAERTVTEVRVQCYDSAGVAADRPFGVAVVRRP